jgi:hypothetical protein
LRGFQSLISQNLLQSVSIPSNPYGLKITEQTLRVLGTSSGAVGGRRGRDFSPKSWFATQQRVDGTDASANIFGEIPIHQTYFRLHVHLCQITWEVDPRSVVSVCIDKEHRRGAAVSHGRSHSRPEVRSTP